MKKLCTFDGCPNPINSKGLCSTHYRQRELGQKLAPINHKFNPNGRADRVCYQRAHQRLRDDKGPAWQHACIECGDQAAHWSYDRKAEDEQQSVFGPYTTRQEHYQPMCNSCHKKFDLNRRQLTA